MLEWRRKRTQHGDGAHVGSGHSYSDVGKSTCEIELEKENAELRRANEILEVVQTPQSLKLFKHLLAEYHYLGFSGTVGENMKYIVFDRYRRPLACLLFGSVALKGASRDQWIGWDVNTRKARLHLVTNNMSYPNINKIQTCRKKPRN